MDAALKGKKKSALEPATVAAIVAALTAGGYLAKEDRIVEIRKTGEMPAWKKAGLVKQMLGRDLSIDFTII